VPSASDHEEQAASNRRFYAEDLGGSAAKRSDWAMTALFYAAVHDVQGLIVRKGWLYTDDKGYSRRPRAHAERLTVVGRECKHLRPEFEALKDWSEAGRYECDTFLEAQLKLAESVLSRLKAEIDKLG
jgi:hypothetical protein